jgi:hypothetical protein
MLPAMLPPRYLERRPADGPRSWAREHTEAILAELGFDREGVRALRAAEAL